MLIAMVPYDLVTPNMDNNVSSHPHRCHENSHATGLLVRASPICFTAF